MSKDQPKKQMKYLIKNIHEKIINYYQTAQQQIDIKNDSQSQDYQDDSHIYYLNQDDNNNNDKQIYHRVIHILQKVPQIPYSIELNTKLHRLADPKYMSKHKSKLFQRVKINKRQYHLQLLQNIAKHIKCLQLPSHQPQQSHQIFLTYKQNKCNLNINFNTLESIKKGHLHTQIIINYMKILELINIIKKTYICQFKFIEILMGKYWKEIYKKDINQISLQLLKIQVKANYEILKKNLKNFNVFQYDFLIVPIQYEGLYSFIVVQGLNSLISTISPKQTDNNEKDAVSNVSSNRRLHRGQLHYPTARLPLDLSKVNIIICNCFMKMKPLAVQMLKLFIKKSYHQKYNQFVFTKSTIPHIQLMLPKQFTKQDSGLYFITSLQVLFNNKDDELGQMNKIQCIKKLHLYPHPLPLLLRERLWNLFVKLLQANDSVQRGLMCKNFANERVKISDKCIDILDFDMIQERQLIKYHPFSNSNRPLTKMQQKERYSFQLSYYLDQSINNLKQQPNL